MSDVYKDFDSMSDSREVMEKSEPKSIQIFLCILILFITIGIILMNIFTIDDYTRVSGEIQKKDSIRAISSPTTSRVKNLYFKDGELVKKGDLLIEFDNTNALEQEDISKKQLDSYRKKEASLEKLKESISKGTNLFNSEETEYYAQYESYELNKITAINEINDFKKENNFSKTELTSSIESLEKQLATGKNEINDYTQLINAINEEKTYASSNSYTTSLFNTYNSNQQNVDDSTKSINKTSFIEKINENINSLKTKNETLNSELVIKRDQLNALDAKAYHEDAVINKITKDSIVEINSQLNSLKESISTSEQQLNEIENTINASKVYVANDGIVNYTSEINIGDQMVQGDQIAQIIPQDEDLYMKISIPENQIAQVQKNMKVKVKVSSIPYQEYGEIKGKVTTISEAYFPNEDKTTNFYIGEVRLNKQKMTNSKGEVKYLKAGMSSEVNIVNGTSTIWKELLKKINLID